MINQRRAGAVLSYINMLIGIVVGFINVRIILSFVSTGNYGVYTVMGSLIAVMGVMDFGLAGTMTRYYTRSLTLHDTDRQENTLAIGSFIYAMIGVLAIIVGFVLYPLIDTIYSTKFTLEELTLAKKMFIIMMMNFTLSISTNIFSSVMMAYEKFVVIKVVETIKTVINPILVYVLLFYTQNIMYVVIVHTAVNMAGVLYRILYSFFKIKIKIKLHYVDRDLFKAISAFAFFIFLNMIMDRVYWQTDNLILGAVVGAQAAAVYGIAATLNRYYLNFSSNIASVFLPKITAISAKTDDMDELNGIFLRIGRVQYIVIMLILSGFVIFGLEFLHVWVGSVWASADIKSIYVFSLIVMVPLVVPLIQNTGISILQAKNKHAFRSVVYIFIAALNFGASIPLAKVYGGYGVAGATAVSLMLGQWLIINIYYKQKIGLKIGTFFKAIFSMTPPIIAVGIAAYFLNKLWIVEALYLLLIKIVIYVIIYFTVSALFVFNQYEKESFGDIVKKILRRK